MSTSIVLNADSFSDATDAFRVRCTVPILVCLSEQDIATQPAPPHLAFKVPETSVISSLSRPIHEGFRRYLAEPNQAPLFWLSRDAAGKDPVPWSMPTGLLAQYVQHEKDLDDDDASAQAHNKFKKVHVVFPIKLYAHFRVTKKGEVFPFHAANMSGSQLVDALFGNALHAFKRSAAIMNPDTFAKFTGKLQPEQMKDLYDLTMMDAVSISRRSELSKFSKGILSSIKVKSWPVMIHSLESGKTLTLAIPARVLIVDSKETVDEQTTSPTDHFNDTDSSSSAGSPVIVRGIQGQFIAHRQMKKKKQQQQSSNKKNNDNNDDNDSDDSDDDENDENKRPTTFGDFVKCLHHRINPGHLDENLNSSTSGGSGGVANPTAAVSSEEELALDLLRRRLIVGGLPDAPLPETPLAWLMEHLVGSDLALHILLLPPNHHTK